MVALLLLLQGLSVQAGSSSSGSSTRVPEADRAASAKLQADVQVRISRHALHGKCLPQLAAACGLVATLVLDHCCLVSALSPSQMFLHGTSTVALVLPCTAASMRASSRSTLSITITPHH
jgi:hypothetical protein